MPIERIWLQVHDAEVKAKAIDEFAEQLKEKLVEELSFQIFIDEDDLLDHEQVREYIDEVAEQLKEGGKNEKRYDIR